MGGVFIFGYGSIINKSTHKTWASGTSAASETNAACAGVATVRRSFGYKRSWNFRSSTGFTALGVSKSSADPTDVNGVLYRVHESELPGFDLREVGYDRIEVGLHHVDLHPGADFTLEEGDRVWIYVPQVEQFADENHPLLQSYVDTVLQGCFDWGGQTMAEEFITSTGDWSIYYLNDIPSSRRPWLHRSRDYTIIDKLLQKYSELTRYSERRHPEQFASAFSQSMRGLWAVPRRNPCFIGREMLLGQLKTMLSGQDSKQSKSIVRVCGFGGVGKSTMVTEFCYRNFPSVYGLVVWLKAETADSLVSDFRSLLSDLSNESIDQERSTAEVISEVKTRLFRSKTPWLIVFDNIEDEDLLERFLPRGAGAKGHVIVTQRRHIDRKYETISMACFDVSESVDLLRMTAEHNLDGTDTSVVEKICEKLGHLPLALSIAATYMVKSDVSGSEYLSRFLNAEKCGTGLNNPVERSLSLTLPLLEPTTIDVLHLLAYLSADMISKPIIRILIGCKTKHEHSMRLSRVQTNLWTASAFACCGLIVGGAMLSSRRRRTSSIALVAGASILASTWTFLSSSIGTSKELKGVQQRQKSATDFDALEYDQCDKAWAQLKSFSLLSVEGGRGSIHRLTQKAMVSFQSSSERGQFWSICMKTLSELWSFSPDDSNTWKESLLHLEHLKSCLGFAEEFSTESDAIVFARLCRECGIAQSMVLNQFAESESSLRLSLRLVRKTRARRAAMEKVQTLNELSKVLRFQVRFSEAEACLDEALALSRRYSIDYIADSYYEFGVLSSKRHQLDKAIGYLEQSLDYISRTPGHDAKRASSLHQLAAVYIATKPPNLGKARLLLMESLSLCHSVVQRASTLRLLARVTIRQGDLNLGDSLLQQALELYEELYPDKTHMNVGAVLFQQGALYLQRNELDKAWSIFNECLRIRKNVYSYASSCGSYPTHFEIAVVAHNLGVVALLRDDSSNMSIEMFGAERAILENLRLAQDKDQEDKIYQAQLTSLTWSRKAALKKGDDALANEFVSERNELRRCRRNETLKCASMSNSPACLNLNRRLLQARMVAREYALGRTDCGSIQSVLATLDHEIILATMGSIKESASTFKATVLPWIGKAERRMPILAACDKLRDELRKNGIKVVDNAVIQNTAEAGTHS